MEKARNTQGVRVTDIVDILPRDNNQDSRQRITRATGMDRKTVHYYLEPATEHGFSETTLDDQLPEITLTAQIAESRCVGTTS